MSESRENLDTPREASSGSAPPPAPPDLPDPVVEAYKKDVDRTLIRENLKLTYAERLQKLQSVAAATIKWRGAASRSSERTQGSS